MFIKIQIRYSPDLIIESPDFVYPKVIMGLYKKFFRIFIYFFTFYIKSEFYEQMIVKFDFPIKL